jgi:hypothetical protein
VRRLAGSVSLLGLGVRGTQLLDAQLGEPLTHIDGRLERLALHDTGDEASGESVSSAVCVVDLVCADGVDLDLLHVNVAALLCADGNGGIDALCDDDCPCALGVLLGALGDALGDLLDILGVEAVCLGEGGGLSLVADQDVDVRQELIERVLEELGDEGCGEVEDEWLHC